MSRGNERVRAEKIKKGESRDKMVETINVFITKRLGTMNTKELEIIAQPLREVQENLSKLSILVSEVDKYDLHRNL